MQCDGRTLSDMNALCLCDLDLAGSHNMSAVQGQPWSLQLLSHVMCDTGSQACRSLHRQSLA